jgi:hypothetical protein
MQIPSDFIPVLDSVANAMKCEKGTRCISTQMVKGPISRNWRNLSYELATI